MSALQIHPLALKFPDMSDADFQDLKDDIKANGQREPIIIYEDMILDGRHRYRALCELGTVIIREREFDIDKDGDPWTFVMSLNMHRRHLNTEQRKAIVAALLEQDPSQSDASAAATAKVDAKTATKVRATLGLPKAKDVKAAKVKAAKAANPKASTKQIAKEAGVDPETAAAALEEKREIPGDPNVAKPEPKAKQSPAARHIEEYAARVASFMSGQPANLALMIKRQAALSALDATTLTQDQRSLLASIERRATAWRRTWPSAQSGRTPTRTRRNPRKPRKLRSKTRRRNWPRSGATCSRYLLQLLSGVRNESRNPQVHSRHGPPGLGLQEDRQRPSPASAPMWPWVRGDRLHDRQLRHFENRPRRCGQGQQINRGAT